MGNKPSSPSSASGNAFVDQLEDFLRETNRQTPRVLDSAGQQVGCFWENYAPKAVKSLPGDAADAVIDGLGSIPGRVEAQQKSIDRSIEQLPQNAKKTADGVVDGIAKTSDFIRDTSDAIYTFVVEAWDNLPEETKDTLREAPERSYVFWSNLPKKSVRMAHSIEACGLNPCYEPKIMQAPSEAFRPSFVSAPESELGSECHKYEDSADVSSCRDVSDDDNEDEDEDENSPRVGDGSVRKNRAFTFAAVASENMAAGGSGSLGNTGNSPNNASDDTGDAAAAGFPAEAASASVDEGEPRESSYGSTESDASSSYGSASYGSSSSSQRVVDGGQFTGRDLTQMMAGMSKKELKHAIQSMIFNNSTVTMNQPVFMNERASSSEGSTISSAPSSAAYSDSERPPQ